MNQISYKLIIRSFDKNFVIEDVKNTFLGLDDGEIIIIPNMAFFVGNLKIHICKVIHANNNIEYLTINGGVVCFENNVLNIFANSFERKQEIDIKRAEESYKRAEEKLKVLQSEADIQRAKIAIEKALNRINLYKKY